MSQITNDTQFREAIKALDDRQQRLLAGRFAENALPLSNDPRLASIIKTATSPDTSEEEIHNAWKTGKTASVELSARCGADGDWSDQADYFVARAATAAVAPPGAGKTGGPAWQAAMNARMAQTCKLIDATDEQVGQVRDQQYQILSKFLDSQENTYHE